MAYNIKAEKTRLVAVFAAVGTLVAFAGIVVMQGWISTAFFLGITATEFGVLAGLFYLLAALIWALA